MVKYSKELEQELCSRFLTESKKIPINSNHWNYTVQEELVNFPGIYGIGNVEKVFYIGSSIYVRSRVQQHSDKIFRLRLLDECSECKLYFYVMYFDDQSPIGKVYADRRVTHINYHENCLIYNLKPLLNRANKSTPPDQLNSEEEEYYRNLIVKQNGIQGFSRFLASVLLSRKCPRWRYDSFKNDIHEKSLRILESSDFLYLVGSFLYDGTEGINPKQKEVIRGIFLGEAYSDVAHLLDCSSGSVQKTAKGIFNYFGNILGEEITKQNFVSVIQKSANIENPATNPCNTQK